MNNIFSDPKQSKDAVVQVASQFNLLEMADPDTTPTNGISIYYYDRTQGPVCAMQTPYGTLFRNYFANVVSDNTKVDGTGTLETGTGQGQLKTQINL
ncbi:hypothetical protein SARC_03706 [Sphaeroforma arctica JP610]|uniref:Uncharacterized protein n=1 Tax=Sphaeroforma arctica JP610 TaxID=667725 RepID=A0A0L0G7A2_9EUKA|nr:hypothetical protein SARC_03706 [Sphaeroforma arctica JP610]KNC84078.1 hypothetical protein SARC_03706 [Sphaeroforma arctica JP610]|eukprot:XP_014157980.1 hypothetical protein SARC_03706 [Sphaeroforma arctica JP610]